MKKFLNSFKTRSLRVGGYSVIATLIVVAIVVFVNVLVNVLPGRLTQFDVTSSKLYSLSDTSLQVVDSVTDDITMYWICQKTARDDMLGNLLDRYVGASGKIRLVNVDPDENPMFGKDKELTLANNSVLVENSERYRYVTMEEIYNAKVDYDAYYTTGEVETTYTFDGENAITAAINFVQNADLPVAYCLTGHSEQSIPETYIEALQSTNIEINEVSLLSLDAVPEDCDVLMVISPASDLSEEEKDMIVDYIDGGGKLLAVTSPPENPRPNFAALMREYNMEEKDGIIMEGNADYFDAVNGKYCIFPDLKGHLITNPLIDSNLRVMTPTAGPLNAMNVSERDVTMYSLLKTSENAYSKVAGYYMQTYEKEAGDLDGPFNVALLAEVPVTEEQMSRVAWISSYNLLNDSVNARVSGANIDFFTNVVAYMADQTETISITGKSMDIEYLTLTSKESTAWTAILTAVIPVLFVIAAIIVAVRRRSK